MTVKTLAQCWHTFRDSNSPLGVKCEAFTNLCSLHSQLPTRHLCSSCLHWQIQSSSRWRTCFDDLRGSAHTDQHGSEHGRTVFVRESQALKIGVGLRNHFLKALRQTANLCLPEIRWFLDISGDVIDPVHVATQHAMRTCDQYTTARLVNEVLNSTGLLQIPMLCFDTHETNAQSNK